MAQTIVVGGSIVGSSLAYHMAIEGHASDVIVVEPDPAYEFAAAPRSAGGIRLMYGLPENIEMSRYGREVFRNFANLMDVDGAPGVFAYRQHGYLFLASGSRAVGELELSCEVQRQAGVTNDLMDKNLLAARFPFLNVSDVDAGLFGPQDGSIDPHAAVVGLRRKAEQLGVRYVKDRVVSIQKQGHQVTSVTLASGEMLAAEAVVNAAGAWAPQVCAMVGMDVPIVPLSRPTFYFEAEDELGMIPLTKDTSGVMFRPEGGGYATGLTRADAPAGFKWDVDQTEHNDFMEVLWPAIAHRVPSFERIKLKRSWAGHYAMNRFDGNAIIGPWTGTLDNFYVAIGFSGAGLQKGPAVGRALTELLTQGRYQTIDLQRLSYDRVRVGQPLLEVGFKA